MPNRIIKHSICDSERLNSVSAEAERLYTRLLVNADDCGRFEATPLVIGTACFPRKFQSDDEKAIIKATREIKEWLSELTDAKLVFLYEHQNRRYLVFYNWQQRLDRIKERFPKPPENVFETNGKPTGNQKETSGNAEVEVELETEVETEPPQAGGVLTAFDEFWKAYPKKVGKLDASKAFRRAVKATTFDKIISAVRSHAISEGWNRDAGKYIPNPATWLNRGSWDDVMETPISTKPKTIFDKEMDKLKRL